MAYQGKRICQIVKVKPERLAEYIEIHKKVPSPVLNLIEKYNIHDYSIFYSEHFQLLIANFKYLGDDLERDSELMRNEPANAEWWKITDGMQQTLVEGSTGSTDPKGWWVGLEEVFRVE
ncbi:unnamed protein product [Kuraishia capsulata CBS 1993]|uniref:L-rhamnose mutarotase n=1 Tax=Kuraishia capsulata CBS 1993 TaxID=1382522 RepID=W6MJQ7_9ASCO|nr:uncharacterized protein KUCA_T00000708001 [Kuraishia capsulata CBS 1993]CDK24742.1 unnamed protein product [Kuraishia capsulata CBS 1993]